MIVELGSIDHRFDQHFARVLANGCYRWIDFMGSDMFIISTVQKSILAARAARYLTSRFDVALSAFSGMVWFHLEFVSRYGFLRTRVNKQSYLKDT